MLDAFCRGQSVDRAALARLAHDVRFHRGLGTLDTWHLKHRNELPALALGRVAPGVAFRRCWSNLITTSASWNGSSPRSARVMRLELLSLRIDTRRADCTTP